MEKEKRFECIYCKGPIPEGSDRIYCSTLCCVRFHYKNRDRNTVNDIACVRNILKRSHNAHQLIVNEIGEMKYLKKDNSALMDKRLKIKKGIERKIAFYQEQLRHLKDKDKEYSKKIKEELIKIHLQKRYGGRTK